jgi:hypothetical protein
MAYCLVKYRENLSRGPYSFIHLHLVSSGHVEGRRDRFTSWSATSENGEEVPGLFQEWVHTAGLVA